MAQPRSTRATPEDELDRWLCTILTALGVSDPKGEMERVARKLRRKITNRRAEIWKWERYAQFSGAFNAERERPRAWVERVVWMTNAKRSIGRKRGKHMITKPQIFDQALGPLRLTLVERRAVEMLLGSRPKQKKNPVETQATRLRDLVEKEWFQLPPPRRGRPKGKWNRNQNTEAQSLDEVLLTADQVIQIAAPIIEEIIGQKISRESDAHQALFWAVKLYATQRDGSGHRHMPINSESTFRALSKLRRQKKLDETGTSDAGPITS